MIYSIISSGSAGNAVVYHETLMVDCGVPYTAIKPYVKQLQIVLLTHEHGDHLVESTVSKLARERPSLWWGVPTYLIDKCRELGVKRIFEVKLNTTIKLFNFFIKPVMLYHNVDNVGYSITNINLKGIYHFHHKLFHATDTYTLEGISAKNYDAYFIEFNYKESEIGDIILEKESMGGYVYEHLSIENHQSFEKAEGWLNKNAAPESLIVKLHVSSKFENQDEGIN